MELIVVSPPGYLAGEAEFINQFFAAGLDRFHIRKPKSDEEQFRQLLAGIDPTYYSRLAIHQHHDLAEEYTIRRLHYSEIQRKLMHTADLDELRGQGFYLSSSVHQVEELVVLQGFDYVFFGPVYDSISKSGYQATLPSDFRLPPHPIKVIAIGGIRAEQLAAIQQMGFDGMALLGALWHSSDPLSAFKQVISKLEELN